ncbi:type II/IV secretion system ATPase subunit [Tardisphaera saccharovorans]
MRGRKLIDEYKVREARVRIYEGEDGGLYEVSEPSLDISLARASHLPLLPWIAKRFGRALRGVFPERADKLSGRRLLEEIESHLVEAPYPLGPEGSEESMVLRAVEELGLSQPTPAQLKSLSHYVWRDLLYMGKLSVPLSDPSLEEVALESYRSPVSVIHRRYRDMGWMRTNIAFSDEAEVQAMVRRMAHSAGKEVSLAFPYLDAVDRRGNRISLTYSSEVSLPGSSFSVRKFPERPLTMADLVHSRALSPLMASYYWIMVESKVVMIIVGGMSAGKTTLLSSVCSLIPRGLKVATIEDVPEVNLPATRWQRFISRQSRLGRGRDVGLMDLLVLSLRYNADYVVLGEARGPEVQAFFQAAALGHGAMTTFHAQSPEAALVRLSSPPLSIGPSELHLISLFSLMGKVSDERGYRRRNLSVKEFVDGKLKEVFQWVPGSDEFYPADAREVVDRSSKLRDVAQALGWSEERLVRELDERARVFASGRGCLDGIGLRSARGRSGASPQRGTQD